MSSHTLEAEPTGREPAITPPGSPTGDLNEPLRQELRHSGKAPMAVVAAASPEAVHREATEQLAASGLPGAERTRVQGLLDASRHLEEGIQALLPFLETWNERTATLPPGPREEWRQSVQTLRECALLSTVHQIMVGEELNVHTLRRVLEPFDGIGALGRLCLALQYLRKAFVVEQLEFGSTERDDFTRQFDKCMQGRNFHDLIEVIARGIGLTYRPVPYYTANAEREPFRFVQGRAEYIHDEGLRRLFGFSPGGIAPNTVVRLERPFFDLPDGRPHLGHAIITSRI